MTACLYTIIGMVSPSKLGTNSLTAVLFSCMLLFGEQKEIWELPDRKNKLTE